MFDTLGKPFHNPGPPAPLADSVQGEFESAMAVERLAPSANAGGLGASQTAAGRRDSIEKFSTDTNSRILTTMYASGGTGLNL